MRNLRPGQPVRVEHNAMVIGLADPDNPYWYEVEYPDGRRETVSLARINPVVDRSRAMLDVDCSIQVFSPRLSAEGALDLLNWLRCNEQELRDAAGLPRDVLAVSEQVMCASCNQLIDPDGLKVHTCPTSQGRK